MASRLSLQSELETILGSEFVYYQPPESIRLTYPCIIYRKINWHTRHADDKLYKMMPQYELIAIDKDPEADWDVKLLTNFKYIRFVRSYTADNLNHWVFELYY